MIIPKTTFKTDATDELCRSIAKKSNGVCFLSFSGGKDSLMAWLMLNNYFRRVIPIHMASYPCLKSRERMLRYYEDAFQTHIVRLIGEEVPLCLAMGAYQTADDLDEILSLETKPYNKLDVYEYCRKEFSLPRAWVAVGISVGDSIDRRIYCKKNGGRNDNNLTFYPIYDYERADILRELRNSGLKLSDEYLWTSRSMGGVPSYTCNKLYRDHWFEDYERIQSIYPLAEAKTYREKMLDAVWNRRKVLGIVSDDFDSGDGDDGTDVMPEFGGEEEFGNGNENGEEM